MGKNLHFLLYCSLFCLMPCVVDAAGTYYNYNGSVQRNYGDSFGRSGYNTQGNCASGGCYGNTNYDNVNPNGYVGNSISVNNGVRNASGVNTKSKTTATTKRTKNNNFKLDAGFSHQFASWNFDMNSAGSKLHYDNLRWNVFDASLKWDFYLGKMPVRLDVGGQYGWQFGESTMVDDDITNGGYPVREWPVDLDGDATTVEQVWPQQGHALSVGTSSGGDMVGVYAGLGLTDVWRIGGVTITPSVGYRYLKYKLQTEQNYGMSLDTVPGSYGYCITADGETQCLPFIVFVYQDSNSVYQEALGAVTAENLDGDGYINYINIPADSEYVATENTYYYHQTGVSHSYEVEWMGPYLALDMNYDISDRNSMNARLEFGLPTYNVTADQPYRPDWQHPKSLEDEGSLGDAYHVGLGANWLHALSDSVMLSIGMTFDYYHVSKADAVSYFNPDYYLPYRDLAESHIEALITQYGNVYNSWTDDVKAAYWENQNVIDALDSLAANGWKQKTKDEIESVYKSMGVRVGLQVKF